MGIMKISLQSIQNKDAWKGYHLPSYDPAEIAANTAKKPQWMHFGSGNIFRIFPAALCQQGMISVYALEVIVALYSVVLMLFARKVYKDMGNKKAEE